MQNNKKNAAAGIALRPLIVSGPPRSGTTLFSAFLDSHSSINWLLDEGFFFEHLHVHGPHNLERFVAAANFGVDSLIDGIRDRSLMPPTHEPPSDYPSLKYAWSEQAFRQTLVNAKPARTCQELWELLCCAYFAGLGYQPRRFISMKAADYGRSCFGALDYFPEARCVVVVRHPVATLNSLKAYRQKYSRRRLTWPTLCEAVTQMNKLAEETARRADDKRLLIIRYEDLLSGTEEVMHLLCRWLDIDFEAALLQPSMMGQPWTNNSSFTSSESGTTPLPKRSTVLEKAEEEYVLWAAEPFRTAFDYGAKTVDLQPAAV
jgi:hypothetical protein